MLNKLLPVVLLALAVVVGYALLATSPEEDAYEPDWAEAPPAGATPPSGNLGVELAGGGRRKDPEPPKRHVPIAVDPRARPHGTLLITPVGPEGEPIDGAALRIYVEPVRKGGFPTRLGRYDEASRSWRFEDVPAGRVSVRMYADHIVRKVETVAVKAASENKIKIKLQPAGAIQYDVIAYDKTRPAKVKLTLYDSKDRPTRAWYEVRTSRAMTTPRAAETITQGPEGVILGILPGRYRLKVVSEFEEYDEAVVNVVAGATQKVSLEVRR